MPAHEHRYGSCSIITQVRLRGDQPIRIQGVTAIASGTNEAHLAVRVAGVLFYLEDRAALEALHRALRQADQLADDVFGVS